MIKNVNQSGFSLVGALAGIAVTAILSIALATLFVNIGKYQAAMEDKVDLLTMKQGLLQEISCRETMLAVNIATGCSPTNYITLRTASGGTVGAAVGTGNFANSRLYNGGWYLRATCSLTDRTLDVRVAKPAGNMTSYSTEPLTKELYDWISFRGRLFGSGSTICSGAIDAAVAGTLDDPTPTPTPAATPTPSGGGGGGGGGGYFTTATLVATGANCITGLRTDDDGNAYKDDVVYAATVSCPGSTMPTGGGVDCNAGGAAGQTLYSSPTADGWTGGCCINKTTAFNGANKLRVICK